jgi:methyl-accepting chemotaxis protein
MTDLAVAQIAMGENASASSAKPRVLSRFVARLRKFMPRLGIVPRLTLIGVLSIFAAVAVAIWASVKITQGEMYRRAQINLSINLKLLDSILAGYGAPSRKGDELYFGPMLINGNFEPVDRVKAVAGGTATIFLGDQRVTTNVMKPDGSRAVGTKLAPGAAYDSVFNQHQTYRGEANILGETYLTIYEPIVSSDTVLGIAYVGVKKAEFFDVLQSLVMTNLALGAGTVLFGGLIMFVLVRRVFAPIGAIRRELVAMAETTTQQGLDARTLATLDNLLDELRRTLYGRGEPRRDGNMLLFGDVPVNNDLALADGIAAQNGMLVTVFMGDERVTTNVRAADGSRVVGTKLAAGPVHDRVLKDGKTYRGEAKIFDLPHFAIYEPILAKGEVVGILFVGTPRLAATERAAQSAAARPADEIGQMRDALLELGKAAKDKENAEKEAAEHRQEARDAQRRFEASQRETQRHLEEERARNAAQQTGVVQALAHGLAKLSDGDLTIRLRDGFTESSRQIRDDFNAAVAHLRETIGSIVGATQGITSASSEISGSTYDLSQRTEQQAASLQETSAAMEEVSATAKKNAENAQHASRSASGARELADRSGQVVASTVEAMARIKESSSKISDIIGLIDEIARQTNLLALNAAVEAARAGDAGRGFAVVASEVRSLAQRSSQAAKDISDLITASNSQVKEGVDLVHKAGSALTEIVQSIKEVAGIVSEIASASSEQSSGIEQIKKALTEMDQITQKNSALVGHSAGTAKTLEKEAAAMSAQVGIFRIDTDDATGTVAAHVAA